MLTITSNIGATISLILGIMAIIWPSQIAAFVSVKSIGKEGMSEIRATYGGFFVGISLFGIATQNSQAFVLLGCGWLCAAIVRLVTLFFGFATPKNIGGVIFEMVIGSLCISPLFT